MVVEVVEVVEEEEEGSIVFFHKDDDAVLCSAVQALSLLFSLSLKLIIGVALVRRQGNTYSRRRTELEQSS